MKTNKFFSKIALIVLSLGLAQSAAAATFTCQAYCGFYAANVFVRFTDTKGRLVFASGSNRVRAYQTMQRECRRIDKEYGLYTSGRYEALATPMNSCFLE